MIFKNHIAHRFLTDDNLAYEIINTMHPGALGKLNSGKDLGEVLGSKIISLWGLVNKDKQTAYVVTSTVEDKLGMLKVKRDKAGHYDWTVFQDVPDCKKTFILYPTPKWTGGACLRVQIGDDKICMCFLKYNYTNAKKDDGQAAWAIAFIDRKTNEHAEHCYSPDVQEVYDFMYKILCFIFLSENEYEVLQPGQSKGSKKSGKVLNDLSVPITIINSKWNVTVVRTEEFWVSPHFALRRVGPGRAASRIVFIDRFKKHGYVRKAANEQLKLS